MLWFAIIVALVEASVFPWFVLDLHPSIVFNLIIVIIIVVVVFDGCCYFCSGK